ncbi:MAG: TrmH family RNA methyltransferase [Actinomycetota bacterium]|nr:TrmH family RNA methyltransferase [Actinomycetota bacterium]
MRNLDGTDLKRLHRDWRRRSDAEVALLLDSVQTPDTVGAILRTAAAYRVAHLWLAGTTAPPANAKTQKTALGTSRFLEWTTCESVEDAVRSISDAGYGLVGVELADGAVPLHEVVFPERVCLAFGHEDRGLSDAVLEACDSVAFIPQLGKVGSLNVATACGIALYEVHRRLW